MSDYYSGLLERRKGNNYKMLISSHQGGGLRRKSFGQYK